MTEEITEAIRNAFNEYLNAIDKVILENQALQIELQHLKQENKELKEKIKKYSAINEQDTKDYAILRNALKEIRAILNKECGVISNAKVVGIINEVLGNEGN